MVQSMGYVAHRWYLPAIALRRFQWWAINAKRQWLPSDTGSSSRDDARMVLMALVPTVPCRNPIIAGASLR